MSMSLLKNAFKFSKFALNAKFLQPSYLSISSSYVGLKNSRTLSRSLFFMSSNRDVTDNIVNNSSKKIIASSCACGCGLHTKSDQELAAFLSEEIENERKAQINDKLPQLEGYEYKLNGSKVTLTKKMGNEIITIKSNLNNSVVAEENVMDPNENQEPQEEMIAKPDFEVEIKKQGKILTFRCSLHNLMSEEDANDKFDDSFEIIEVSLHDGEVEDSTYFLSGDIMDGYLYDLFMNYLEERGISNEFTNKMITFFTTYEQQLYINLLRGMKSFVEK